jgi:hypothetical protein
MNRAVGSLAARNKRRDLAQNHLHRIEDRGFLHSMADAGMNTRFMVIRIHSLLGKPGR